MHDMLKILSIIVGIVAAVTRLAGVVSPEFARSMLRTMLEKRIIPLILMVVVAVLGSFLIWGFRLYASDVPSVPWAAWVLLGLGVAMAAGGLLFLAMPGIPLKIMARFYVAQTTTMRLLCLFGALAGTAIVLIAWLGL